MTYDIVILFSQMNRRLSKIEIWLKDRPRLIRAWEITLLITIIFVALCLVRVGLEKDAQMEDIKMKQYQESTR